MSYLSSTALVSFVSVKGGTGKTTAAISLAALLSDRTSVALIEAQRENPQYRHLLLPEGISLRHAQGREGDKELVYASGEDLPSFQTQNLSLVPLDLPKGRSSVETTTLSRTLFSAFDAYLRSKGQFTSSLEYEVVDLSGNLHTLTNIQQSSIVLVDYDAGLDRTLIERMLPFHRAVHGYGVTQSVREHVDLNGLGDDVFTLFMKYVSCKDIAWCHQPRCNLDTKVVLVYDDMTTRFFSSAKIDITKRPFPVHFASEHEPVFSGEKTIYKERTILKPMPILEEETYAQKERFGKGIIVFVASPAIAEIGGIIDRAFFFRDLGVNNHYVLIINQAKEEDARLIEEHLRRGLGKSYMFDLVIGLPHIPYMQFGNIRAQGNHFMLPVQECQEYKQKLSMLAEYVQKM